VPGIREAGTFRRRELPARPGSPDSGARGADPGRCRCKPARPGVCRIHLSLAGVSRSLPARSGVCRASGSVPRRRFACWRARQRFRDAGLLAGASGSDSEAPVCLPERPAVCRGPGLLAGASGSVPGCPETTRSLRRPAARSVKPNGRPGTAARSPQPRESFQADSGASPRPKTLPRLIGFSAPSQFCKPIGRTSS
jgi:hypothetical protein